VVVKFSIILKQRSYVILQDFYVQQAYNEWEDIQQSINPPDKKFWCKDV